MPFDNLDAELLNTFGTAGSYTPAGGRTVYTQILIEEQADPFAGADFDGRYQEQRREAFILATAAPNPKRGDALKVGAVTYQVDEVVRDDGLLVRLSVRVI